MSKGEKLLAADLLAMASDAYSDHTCNDFSLPESEENVRIALEADELAHVRDGRVHTSDWILMDHLAKLLRSEADVE